MNDSQRERTGQKEREGRGAWLPPGFRHNTPKRNVLVTIAYLILLSVAVEILRLVT